MGPVMVLVVETLDALVTLEPFAGTVTLVSPEAGF